MKPSLARPRQTELGETKTELGETKTELGETKTELGEVKAKLTEVQHSMVTKLTFDATAEKRRRIQSELLDALNKELLESQ